MANTQPKISIVIPCYNHGEYMPDTLTSIEQIEDKGLYEVIIVNDGSTDVATNEYLRDLQQQNKPNYTVLFQENQGVCIARNNALKHATGEYVLPVDSDNKITKEYVYKAIEVLDNNEDITIVYCDYTLMGEETGIKVAGPFNLQRLMLGNFIDNCSVYRRSLLSKIGYLETYKTINGVEDWEFWLRAAFNGYKFHYINEPLFEYRVLENSGTARLKADKSKGISNTELFKRKYKEYYGPQYIDDYFLKKFKSSPIGLLGKIILMSYFPKKFEAMVKKAKLRRHI